MTSCVGRKNACLLTNFFSCCVLVSRNKYEWLVIFIMETYSHIYQFWKFSLLSFVFLVSLAPSPPYPSGTFDRILLDAPCSALGQRLQFVVRMNLKELQSYPRLQRKLFTTVRNKNCSCALSLGTVWSDIRIGSVANVVYLTKKRY